MISGLYEDVLRSSFGLSMAAIWQHMTVFVSDLNLDFSERTDIFFELLERLLSEDKIRFASNGEFWDESVDFQLNKLKCRWPKNPECDDLDGFGIWFLTEANVGVVWISDNGQSVWT